MEKKMSNFQILSANKPNAFSILSIAEHIVKNQFGFAFIATSEVYLKAPKTTANEWLKEYGTPMPNFRKVTLVTNAKCQEWERGCNQQIEKVTGNTGTFESEPLKGFEWIIYPIIKKSTKDNELSLTITFTNADKTAFTSRYFIEGRGFATDAEVNFIKSHLANASVSRKQEEQGVAAPLQKMTRNYKFKNILSIGKISNVENVWKNANE